MPSRTMPWRFIALLVGSTLGWVTTSSQGPLYDASAILSVRDANELENLPEYLNRPQCLDPIIRDLRLPMTAQQLATRVRVMVDAERVHLFFRTGDPAIGQEVVRRLSTRAMSRLVFVVQEKERALSAETAGLEESFRLQRETSKPPNELSRALVLTRERLGLVRDRLRELSAAPAPQLRTQRLSPWGVGLQRGLVAMSFGLLSMVIVSWGLSGKRMRATAESHENRL